MKKKVEYDITFQGENDQAEFKIIIKIRKSLAVE